MHLYTVLSYVFRIGCLIGCSVQLTVITCDYFLFKTLTALVVAVPEDLTLPEMSACIRYPDIISTSDYKRDKGIDLPEVRTLEELKIIESTLTIGDIFKYTPSNESLFMSCAHRHATKYGMSELIGQECDQIFKVRRFVLTVRFQSFLNKSN